MILCDHTKLGTHDTLNADITLKGLLRNTARCTVVSTWPDDDTIAIERLEQEIAALKKTLDSMSEDEDLNGKEFTLLFVRCDGTSRIAASLGSQRKGTPKQDPTSKERRNQS